MDRVIRVNLGNVSATSCDYDSLLLEASNVAACVAKGKSESFDCRNHIRVIQPIGTGDRLYICGTNAHNPQVGLSACALFLAGRNFSHNMNSNEVHPFFGLRYLI